MESSHIQSMVSWIRHYQEEKLHLSPALAMEPFRLYSRDGFSVFIPATIMMACSSLAKKLFIPTMGGQDIFLPSTRRSTLLLLEELLRSGITYNVGLKETMKDVQDLMQLLEIDGSVDVVRTNQGTGVIGIRHIQTATSSYNNSKSKLDKNGHRVLDQPDFSNILTVSSDSDINDDREFNDGSNIKHVQSALSSYDNSLDNRLKEGNANFVLNKPDFSNILMVSSDTDTDDDREFSDIKDIQNVPISHDNSKKKNKRIGKDRLDSSNVLEIPRNTDDDGYFDNKHVQSDKVFPKIRVIHSGDSNFDSKKNNRKIHDHSGQKIGFRDIKFCHGLKSESRTRKRFRTKDVLRSRSKKDLMRSSLMSIEDRKDDSKVISKNDKKVSERKFTLKRSCNKGFEALEESDSSADESLNGDMKDVSDRHVFFEDKNKESEALVEGKQVVEGLADNGSSVEDNNPVQQVEFLALFNLCTHTEAAQIRARIATKPTTSRLKRIRAKLNKKRNR